jgi:hypothetical protein
MMPDFGFYNYWDRAFERSRVTSECADSFILTSSCVYEMDMYECWSYCYKFEK